MAYDRKLVELAVKLFSIDAVKFGDFTTKSGIKTPVYFDLRVIVSYPEVMVSIVIIKSSISCLKIVFFFMYFKFQESISNLLLEFSMKNLEYDHLCGVPYTALPIATLLSVQTKKSMLMRRKETKAYGTKKSVEGHYKAGQSCLIVEDVVTSGSSVLETVRDLRKEGLIVKDAVIILDREQGGSKNCAANDVQVKSLLSLTALIEILSKNGKITDETVTKVKNYLKETQAPVIGKSIVDKY